MDIEHIVEEFQVLGRDLVDKVRALIHEGNVQRIVVAKFTIVVVRSQPKPPEAGPPAS